MTSPRFLLDSNLMIALALTDHQHHRSADLWVSALGTGFATCPITEGALVRVISRSPGSTALHAVELLRRIVCSDRHEFWPDDRSYLDVPTVGLIGHRQVTDAYLAQLARYHGGRLATFDEGLAGCTPTSQNWCRHREPCDHRRAGQLPITHKC